MPLLGFGVELAELEVKGDAPDVVLVCDGDGLEPPWEWVPYCWH